MQPTPSPAARPRRLLSGWWLILAAFFLAAARGLVGAAAGEIAPASQPGQTAPAQPADAPPAATHPPPKSWSVATAESIIKRNPGGPNDRLAPWTYFKGFPLYGFEMLWRSTGDPRYLAFVRRQIDPFVDAAGNVKNVKFEWLDNMLTGNLVVALYEHTGEERYRSAATQIRRAFDTFPRNADGGFWHAAPLPGEMWIDGVFMGQMFLLRYGKSVGDRDWCYDEAVRQITVFARHAQKNDSGLYYHAWAAKPESATVWPKRTVLWADPRTGLSSEVWSEGLGWYALVLSEALAVLPADHPRRAEVVDIFRRLAAGLKRTQDPASGRWFQVVDKGDRPDNWTDTSGSAMFTYLLQKGIDLGVLNRTEYAPVVAKAYRGITSFARVNDEGLVDIYGACDGVCVQADYAAYINYPRRINAKEAVGAFLWATALVEKPAASGWTGSGSAASGGPAPGAAASWGGNHRFACTDYTQGKVFVFSAEGRPEWEYPAETCNDLSVLPGDNLLFNTGHGVKEVTRDRKVVFEYNSASEIYACQRLPDGNTFVAECNSGRLLELSPAGAIVKEVRLLPEGTDGGHAYMRNARRLDNGHTLVAHYGSDVVREYDSAGKTVREIPAAGGPHTAERLANGHTLISCGDHPGGPRIFEVDAAGKTIWEVREGDLPGISLKFIAGFQRLPNGNTVFANWLGHGQFGRAPHLIEVTPEKKVVWTYGDNSTLVTASNIRFLEEPAAGPAERSARPQP